MNGTALRLRGVCLCLLALALAVGGCDEDGYVGPRYTITGGAFRSDHDPGSDKAIYTITDDGVKVYDATVTVNGSPAGLTLGGEYMVWPVAVSPGEAITLQVTVGDFWAGATVTMPEKLTVIAPTGTQTASKPITVEWDPPSLVPDRVQVSVPAVFTVSGEFWYTFVDGTQTSAEIPGGTLTVVPGGVDVFVYAVNDTTDLGPRAGSASRVNAAYSTKGPLFSTE